MRRVLTLAVIVVGVAGCTGGSRHSAPTTAPSSPTLRARAEQLCRATVPDPEHLTSSEPTTIGAIRGVTIGTIGPAQTRSFAPLEPSDFGAWCWTLSGGTYTIYKAAGSAAIGVAGEQERDVPAAQAHGAPSIP